LSATPERTWKESQRAVSLGRTITLMKPQRLAASLFAVALGGALALGEPGLARWPLWGAVALAALLMQVGGRLLLLAAGARRSLSRSWSDARRYSELSVSHLFLLGGVCLAAGAACGFLAVIERGWPMFWLGVAGIFGAISYAHGPTLREKGLGEVVSFFLFGPFPVAAAYLAVTGVWSPYAVQVSVPLGLLAAAASLSACIRDGEPDRKAGGITLATIFGRPRVDYLYLILVAAAYAWLLVLILRGLLAPFCLLPLVTMPQAIRGYALLRAFPVEGADELRALVPISTRTYLYFGATLALSVAVSHLIWQQAI
jgi:1,4-dihydroxy-2-naphthoate octaprenyltransferase